MSREILGHRGGVCPNCEGNEFDDEIFDDVSAITEDKLIKENGVEYLYVNNKKITIPKQPSRINFPLFNLKKRYLNDLKSAVKQEIRRITQDSFSLEDFKKLHHFITDEQSNPSILNYEDCQKWIIRYKDNSFEVCYFTPVVRCREKI